MQTELSPVLGILGRMPCHMARIASSDRLHMFALYMIDCCMLLSCYECASGACHCCGSPLGASSSCTEAKCVDVPATFSTFIS